MCLWVILQRGLAAALLTLALPLLALLWVLVRWTSPGPFLFCQMRAGAGGQPFRIFKVRTMSIGGGPSRTLGVSQDHPGITRLGRILRELKLDELPQLWNVIRGDMLFVGPRPLPVDLDGELRRRIPGFELRGSTPPGLASVGQFLVDDNAVGEGMVRDWRERFEAERHYLRHRSVPYDCVVMGLAALYLLRKFLRTVRPAPRGSGAATLILGVPIANLDYEGVTRRIARWITLGEARYVGVCPVHSVVEAQHDADHLAALRGADLNTADGMPIVWCQWLLGNRASSRVYGPTLMLRLLDEAERQGWRVAFYGGREDRLERMIQRVTRTRPGLRVVEAISPPFRPLAPAEESAMVKRLRAARPDLVFVGIGSPRQEKFMARHSGSIPGVQIGVGAAFDFHAGAVRQCPAPLQRIGLEWAFRLAMEPRRLARRYARANPEFVLRIAIQLVRALLGRNYQIHDHKTTTRTNP